MYYFSKIKSYIKTTHFKTTLWYSTLFLILEITIGATIYFYLRNSMVNKLDHSLNRQADLIYHFVSEKKVDLNDFQPDSTYTSPDELVYDVIFEAVSYNPNNTYVQIYLKNKLIYKSENLRDIILPFPATQKDSIRIRNLNIEDLSESVIRAANYYKDDYKIIVAFPVQLINTTLQSLIDIYLLMAPIFFIFSIMGGAVISRGFLSRIDSIIKKTEEITTQNLDEKIPGEEFNDEYGRLVKTLNDMNQRIKVSIDYLNQFSVAASHELKTPLTILRGELELALRSNKTAENYKEVLQSNYEETLRLISIVDRLFFISRIDNSKISLNIVTVNVSEFLAKIVNQLRHFAEEKNIVLKTEFCDNVTAEFDPELMRQSVFNLVENAIKYGDENETVHISCNSSDGKISMSVKNKGEGIPDNSLPLIFNRFYRVESSRNRNTGGIGLGLAIVKSIVGWHKGEIKVISEPQKETIFTITLPISAKG